MDNEQPEETEQLADIQQPTNTEQPATTEQPRIHPAVQAIIGIAVAIGAGFGAFVSWFVGIVTFTGCFISCGEPNELGGMGLMAVTAVLVGLTLAALGYTFIGWSRETLIRLLLLGTGVGAMLGIASLVAS
ncbi:MAG: hypothetical protein WD990_07105 [Acidimicrobiia bacterium]